MKFPFRIAVAVLLPLTAMAATREVLIGTGPTRIPRTASTTAIALKNVGPNPICCAQAPDAGYPDCWPIETKEVLSLDVTTNQPVTCITTVAQLPDAGTRIIEVF